MDCFLYCLVAELITKLFQMKVIGQWQQKPTASGADLVGLPRINLLSLLLIVVIQSVVIGLPRINLLSLLLIVVIQSVVVLDSTK